MWLININKLVVDQITIQFVLFQKYLYIIKTHYHLIYSKIVILLNLIKTLY